MSQQYVAVWIFEWTDTDDSDYWVCKINVTVTLYNNYVWCQLIG